MPRPTDRAEHELRGCRPETGTRGGPVRRSADRGGTPAPPRTRRRRWDGVNRRRWEQVRRQVLDRDNWICTRCSAASRMEVHHVVRVEDGGEVFALANLVTLCTDCHYRLHRPPRPPGSAAWDRLLADML